MSTIVVTTLNDVINSNDGETSLREALTSAAAAAGADTITFAGNLSGGTSVLSGGQLLIAQDVTIDGDLNNDGIADITINGDTNNNGAGDTRLFGIDSGIMTLQGLKTLIAAHIIRIVPEEWMAERTVDALHHLDDRRLKDIGVTRGEVESAARWRRRNLLTIGTVHTELPPGHRISLSAGESNNANGPKA